jgi:mono/diheme cytochrome c family protein
MPRFLPVGLCGLCAALLGLGAPAAAGDFGRQNYIQHCAGCHQFDGSGSPAHGVPNMKNVVGHFLRLPEGRAFLVQVPGTAQAPLKDAQIAEMLNWMLARFSREQMPADFVPYGAEEVRRYRETRLDDVAGRRSAIVTKLQSMGYAVE